MRLRCQRLIFGPSSLRAALFLALILPQFARAQEGGLPPRNEWKVTASDSETNSTAAALACDGNNSTRWSSTAGDNHWLQVDLGRSATVCGLTILWETAFGTHYRIETSDDGRQWTTVYKTRQGDGHTDIIQFAPTRARYVKFIGSQRGTSWGYSIWELDLWGLDRQAELTAPTDGASGVQHLVDGSWESVWTSDGSMPCTIRMDLRRPTPLGGLRIDWGDNYATEAELFASTDGTAWDSVGGIREGLGRIDVLSHGGKTVRFLRLELRKASGDEPVSIKEITLRGPDEDSSPLALYRLAAERARPGMYPTHLLNNQIYWTVVGLPGDRAESLLDEYGNLEAKIGSPSLMPYVLLDGKLHSALDAQSVTQRLLEAHLPMPEVAWKLGALEVNIEAVAGGTVADSVTYVRYELSNVSDAPQTGRLYLAVRPVGVNPPWQFGGFSPVKNLSYHREARTPVLQIDFVPAYVLLTTPDDFGARSFDGGDVLEDLMRGRLPTNQAVAKSGDLVSGALAYDFSLAKGEKKSVVVAAPLHGSTRHIDLFMQDAKGRKLDAGAAFDQQREAQRKFWKDLVDRVRIEIPRKELVNVLRSQVAYILINRDGAAIQPGSRNYKRSWMRDGCLTSAAMLRMGLFDEVRTYLEWYSDRVQPDGWVPPILNNDGTLNDGFGWDIEYDSQGEYLYTVMEYYRFTRDRAFLDARYDKMLAAMKFMVKLREQTLAPDYLKDDPARDRFFGLLPASISHEGYNPPKHSYWDDFWALKGWKDGAAAARVLGREKDAAWADEQYQLLRESLRSSIAKTMASGNKNFLPGCAEFCDFDPTSASIALFPCEESGIVPDEVWKNTFEQYYKVLSERFDPKWVGGFTPYELRSALCLVNLNQRKRAVELIDNVLSYNRPLAWNQMSEVAYSDPRLGRYIGDMPHTWCGSGYVNSLRGMLATEEGEVLHLLPGALAEWLESGKGVLLENVPTHFGSLNLRGKIDANVLTVTLGGTAAPPESFRLHWPREGRPSQVKVDGKDWTDFNDQYCSLPRGTKKVTASW
jgi:hypothetical protein